MVITIHNTTKIVNVNGVPARIWEGHTDSGIEVHCFVTRIGAPKDADLAQFERELEEQLAPSEAVATIPLRLIL